MPQLLPGDVLSFSWKEPQVTAVYHHPYRPPFPQMRQRNWEKVPRWHWRYWFGYRMRRWTWDAWTIGGEYDGSYDYATYEDCARTILEEKHGLPDTPRKKTTAQS